jgi:hypothetical protein
VSLLSKTGDSLRSALFWNITLRRVVIFSDVSGQRIGPIFKGHTTPCYIPEDHRSINIAAEAWNQIQSGFSGFRMGLHVLGLNVNSKMRCVPCVNFCRTQ